MNWPFFINIFLKLVVGVWAISYLNSYDLPIWAIIIFAGLAVTSTHFKPTVTYKENLKNV